MLENLLMRVLFQKELFVFQEGLNVLSSVISHEFLFPIWYLHAMKTIQCSYGFELNPTPGQKVLLDRQEMAITLMEMM